MKRPIFDKEQREIMRIDSLIGFMYFCGPELIKESTGFVRTIESDPKGFGAFYEVCFKLHDEKQYHYLWFYSDKPDTLKLNQEVKIR